MARFLHTRIRVGDLARSIDWYCQNLGFVVKSRTDRSPDGNHVAHLELPGNAHTLELTWSAEYRLAVPDDLMHLAIAVPDLASLCDQLETQGTEVWPEGWREKLASGRRMVFVDDPDGYEIELIQD